jgi:hypothetical protein
MDQIQSISRHPYFLGYNKSVDARMDIVNEDNYVVALDIDECSVVGSNTNEILTLAVHAMENNFHLRRRGDNKIMSRHYEKEILEKLAINLINPSMVNAIHDITSKTKKMPYIVVYTNKVGIGKTCTDLIIQAQKMRKDIMQSSGAERRNIKAKILALPDFDYALIQGDNGGNTLFLEGTDKSDDKLYLARQWDAMIRSINFIFNTHSELNLKPHIRLEIPHIEKMPRSLYTLGIQTWAISRILGLEYNIPVFISAVHYKDLNTICPKINCPFNKIWLYDDIANIHAQRLRQHKPELHTLDAISLHLIQVQKFNFNSMSEATRKNIVQYMYDLIPDPDAFFRENDSIATLGEYLLKQAKKRPDEQILTICNGHFRFIIGNDLSQNEAMPWQTDMFFDTT